MLPSLEKDIWLSQMPVLNMVSITSRIGLEFGLTNLSGSIARIGPNTVVTCDADLVRKMNAPRGSGYTRGKWYKAFKLDAERENLFTELDEERHANMRARISPGVCCL